MNKNGTGLLLLTGVNTYAGGTTDQGSGVLEVNNGSALGSGNLAIAAATISASGTSALTFSNTVSMSNGTSAIFGVSGTGNLSFGAMTIGTTETLTVNNVATTVASFGSVSTSTVTKLGTGAFLVSGNDTVASPHYDIQGGMFGVAGTWAANNLNLDGGVAGLNGTYNKGLTTSTGGGVDLVGDGHGRWFRGVWLERDVGELRE